MSKNAMAGAVTLCGVGLCMIGGALMMQGGQQAHAVAMNTMPAAASALASAATAQAGSEPTVVWYQASPPVRYSALEGPSAQYERHNIYRAWSNGVVEYRTIKRKVATYALASDGQHWTLVGEHYCEDAGQCASPWIVCSSPEEGYKASADINADEMVDGADLAMMLGSWGDAPRVPFPPSDCPLNLINP